MCKKRLRKEQGMSSAAYVDEARRLPGWLVSHEIRGSGDTEGAMRRIERCYGVPYAVLWSNRYSPPKSIGAAIFGSVLASRLAAHLAEGASAVGGASVINGINVNNIQAIRELTGPVRDLVLSALTYALNDVFLTGVPFAAVSLVVALFLPEVPLASRHHGPSVRAPAD